MLTRLLICSAALALSSPVWAETPPETPLPPRETSPVPVESMPADKAEVKADETVSAEEQKAITEDVAKEPPVPSEEVLKDAALEEDVPETITAESTEPKAPPPPVENKPAGPVVPITPYDFNELSLTIRPGAALLSKNPGNWTDPAFNIYASVSLFLHRRIALNVPYTYGDYGAGGDIHSVGAGPLVRFLDMDHFRGSVEASGLYVRALGRNRWGWSAAADITYGSRKLPLRPFIGPFVRYEALYLPGPDLRMITIGASITLTKLTEFE